MDYKAMLLAKSWDATEHKLKLNDTRSQLRMEALEEGYKNGYKDGLQKAIEIINRQRTGDNWTMQLMEFKKKNWRAGND